MKQNIGQKLALYPTPATVVGTVGEEGKVNWLLVAHVENRDKWRQQHQEGLC